MMAKGMLIDYEFCCGCHACEVACQMENDLPPEQGGIKLAEIGPWAYNYGEDSGDKQIQYIFVPIPTDQCDLCAGRTAVGKLPTCVKHCMSRVISYGEIAQLKEAMADKPKLVLFTLDTLE
jgi:anaerobic dimethyl sulfoxide reductase subunit B (iron-sulfur subunit)